MRKRPAISVKTKVDVAIYQAQTLGANFWCPLCSGCLIVGDERILEHMVPHELGGASNHLNMRWVHKACADKKTRGCEGTSKKGSVANGDTHRIRKAGRIADGGKKVRRPMPKTGRKMQSHANPWGKR